MFSSDLTAPEAKDAVTAAVSHPQYKLKWVPHRENKLCSVQTSDAEAGSQAMSYLANNDKSLDT